MVELEPSVLIVDDERGDVERITKAFDSIRLRVLTVSDPHEVLRKVGAEQPDLVIMDALLPGLSGFDLCKQIKTEPDTKNTMVVILTGVYLKDHYRREAIHQFKADAFATKPFRDRELQRVVLKLLAKKLQVSPKELQESLADSQDILLTSEVEEKPSWFGRIFGRRKGVPPESGFLHTVTETLSAEEPVPDEEEASITMEETDVLAEEDGREDVVSEEPEEAVPEKAEPEEAVPEATTEEMPEDVEEEAGIPPESEPPQPETASADAASVEEEREEPLESTTEIEDRDEPEPHEPADSDDEAVRESEEVAGEIPVEQPLETGVDLHAARAVFEEIGHAPDEAVEAVEKNVTEKTMPAITVPAAVTAPEEEVPEEPAVPEEAEEAAQPDGSDEAEEAAQPDGSDEAEEAAQPDDSDEAEVAERPTELAEAEATDQPKESDEAEVPASPPRPMALHEDLPIYQEEDYIHELKREMLMCARVGRPLTLIMVRIADLDQIVELLGRQFRTKVLFHVAEQALQSLREIDMVGLVESKELIALTAFASDRWGGDKIVSRLRTLLGHNPFQVGEGLPSFIPDLRFGMAAYPKEVGGFEELLERAEDELEKARRSGR